MRLKFRGWSRRVTTHTHNVVPVRKGGHRYYADHDMNTMSWSGAMTAYGKVHRLALSGDFLVEFTFTKAELRDWLRAYFAQNPEAASDLVVAVQAEAVRRLAKKQKRNRKTD